MWGGIIGARLWFCLFFNLDYYLAHPIDIIKLWDGGLAFHGGFVGGLLASYLFCKKKNKPFIKFLDAVAPTVLIGQAIGRWGNFINQECHGSAVTADYFWGPLKLIRDGMLIGGVYYKPLFLYESLLCLIESGLLSNPHVFDMIQFANIFLQPNFSETSVAQSRILVSRFLTFILDFRETKRCS